MPEVLDSALDYSRYPYLTGEYELTQQLPYTNGAITINAAGGQEALIDIPAHTINLSESWLMFDAAVAASGVGIPNFVWANCMSFIRQIQLYTKTGIMLADIPVLPEYTAVTWPASMKLQDFLTQDSSETLAANAITQAWTPIFRPSTVGTLANNPRPNNDPAMVPDDEMLYFYNGGLNAANPTLNVRFPLKQIYDSIFALNKDIYFGEIVTLRMVFNQATNICFIGGGTVIQPGTAPAPYVGDVTLTNLQLLLAIEKKASVLALVQGMFQSQGIRLMVPYVYYNTQRQTGTTQSLSLRIGGGYGKRLLKIWHSCFHNTRTLNQTYAHENVNVAAGIGRVVSSWYSQLNGFREQQFNYTCASLHDYMDIRKKLHGTAILNSNIFYENWFILRDYSGHVSEADEPRSPSKDNLDIGLDLQMPGSEYKWDVYLTVSDTAYAVSSAANYQPATDGVNHFQFYVVTKELICRPGLITFQ